VQFPSEVSMPFKFERLEVWQLALDYVDLMYQIGQQLPSSEQYNLVSQLIRAATSIALNIAEGSTGQSNAEQNRFLGMAIRSLMETVACQRLITRRYPVSPDLIAKGDLMAQELAKKLHAFRQALGGGRVREEQAPYLVDLDNGR
ncbi:MAG: four helix bundle protein, partial [Anaerolineae bacterium]